MVSVLQLDERTGLKKSDTGPTTAGPSYKTTITCIMFSTCSKLKCVFGTMYVGFFLVNECWKCRLISLLPLRKPSGEEAGADIILSFVRLAVGGTAFGILCGLIGARVLHKI